ncbi:MAG: hypothetical protein V1793_15625 [Pseudomonadota bacterium]
MIELPAQALPHDLPHDLRQLPCMIFQGQKGPVYSWPGYCNDFIAGLYKGDNMDNANLKETGTYPAGIDHTMSMASRLMLLMYGPGQTARLPQSDNGHSLVLQLSAMVEALDEAAEIRMYARNPWYGFFREYQRRFDEHQKKIREKQTLVQGNLLRF